MEIKQGDKVWIKDDCGSEIESIALSNPWELVDGTRVIKVQGFVGGYYLSRVRKFNQPLPDQG